MRRRFNALVAVATLTSALYGCGGHDSAPQTTAEARAEAMEKAWNSGRVVTGVTIEKGYEITFDAGELPGYPRAVAIEDPIRLDADTYAYAESNGRGVNVDTIDFTGRLATSRQLDKERNPMPTGPAHQIEASVMSTTNSGNNTGEEGYYYLTVVPNPGSIGVLNEIIRPGAVAFAACDENGCG